MTKLLPFDLAAAKAGAKVVTRDGRPVRIVCWDMKDKICPVMIGLVTRGENESVWFYRCDGRVYQHRESDNDLFMAPTPVKRWRVVYRGDDDHKAERDFETSALARAFMDERGMDNVTNAFEVEVTP